MILVTGANGYIGYNLTKKLLEETKKVRAFCHRKSENIDKLKKKYNKQLEIVYGNIEEVQNYQKIMNNVDVVYHLAAKTTEESDIENINTIATKELFEKCIEYHVKKVVFFSTVAVYKPNKIVTISSKKEPANVYGKTKLEAENIGMEYYKKNKLPLIILEPCSVYGKTYNGSMGKILKKAEKGYCIKIGKGEYKNTVIHIDDLVTIAIKVVQNEDYIGKTLICGTETITINEINNTLKSKLKNNIYEIYIPYKLAMLILKLPFHLKIKSTIKQLTRESEYITNYNMEKYIKYEEYINNGVLYDRKHRK